MHLPVAFVISSTICLCPFEFLRRSSRLFCQLACPTPSFTASQSTRLKKFVGIPLLCIDELLLCIDGLASFPQYSASDNADSVMRLKLRQSLKPVLTRFQFPWKLEKEIPPLSLPAHNNRHNLVISQSGSPIEPPPLLIAYPVSPSQRKSFSSLVTSDPAIQTQEIGRGGGGKGGQPGRQIQTVRSLPSSLPSLRLFRPI